MRDGTKEVTSVGIWVVTIVGPGDGSYVGTNVGKAVGTEVVGPDVGIAVGSLEPVGITDKVGKTVGMLEGWNVGPAVGPYVGN